ncbi:hypothetical protein MRX96_056558 [Rhipicephalus microplus]
MLECLVTPAESFRLQVAVPTCVEHTDKKYDGYILPDFQDYRDAQAFTATYIVIAPPQTLYDPTPGGLGRCSGRIGARPNGGVNETPDGAKDQRRNKIRRNQLTVVRTVATSQLSDYAGSGSVPLTATYILIAPPQTLCEPTPRALGRCSGRISASPNGGVGERHDEAKHQRRRQSVEIHSLS